MISKFTQKELETFEAEIELKAYKEFQAEVGFMTGLPRLSPSQETKFKLGYQKCSPLVWDFFEKSPLNVKQKLFNETVYQAILNQRKIDRYELVCNNLMPFMNNEGPKEKQTYNAFKYYKELSSEAMRHFLTHFEKGGYFGFSTSAYEQWFSSLRLGLYSAPERVLSGIGSLNFPDLKPVVRNDKECSPRLHSL